MSTKKSPAKKAVKKAPAKRITNQRTGLTTSSARAPKAPRIWPKTLEFARTFRDPESKFLLVIQMVSGDIYNAKTQPAAVNVRTIVNNVSYEEQVEFQNSERALEYVSDFSVAQSKRFALAALASYEKNDRDHNTGETMAMTPKEKK